MKFRDSEMEMYFKSLPAFVQESIMQSGVKPGNVQELKSIARNITEKKNGLN